MSLNDDHENYVWFVRIMVLEVAHGDDKNQDDFPRQWLTR